ncbi:hypothetical protein OKW21_006728 [Catalinimonas alkaloidigena]|uniref:hypothetical protein n=1 Tax=Catalinimonas alkaloidigena TaxID=1075417 RepID=UPI00240750D5|nr:hypothetical protein [Catalinimonas alkaloidigena]MDF9801419.1 hypothetical protein [Catalinimonas alkaloidigena]
MQLERKTQTRPGPCSASVVRGYLKMNMIRNLLILSISILSLFACDAEESKLSRNVFLTHSISDKYNKISQYNKQMPEKAKWAFQLAKKIKGVSDTCYMMLPNYKTNQIIDYIKQHEKTFPTIIRNTLKTATDAYHQSNSKLDAEKIQIVENEILSQLIDFAFSADLRFDTFSLVPIAKSDEIKDGETYVADVFFSASNSSFPTKIIINEEYWKDTLTFDQSSFPHVKIDKNRYQKGMNTITPKYVVETIDGKEEYEFEINFEVK